jgi:predicted NBD/HSP70 family sugar kinase
MSSGRAVAIDPGSGSLSAALHLVHTEGPIRRSELTSRLGLSRSAVGALVEELRAQQLVTVETSPLPAGDTGRPSHLVSPDPDGPVAAAVALSAQTFRVALVGLGGVLIAPTEHRLPQPTTPGRVLPVVARAVLATLATTSRPCVGVGLAVPSAVSRQDEHALAALYLRWPAAVPVRDRMVDLLGESAAGRVHVGNDANLAALAEHRHGAGAGATDMLFLATGQRGVGGALVAAGRLHTGSAGYALEVGHLTVDPAGRRCHCGSRGCLDVEADPMAVLTAAGRRPRGDIETAARRVLAAVTTDPRARAAAEQVADRLGVGLAGLVNLFNPDRIVLGGLHAQLLDVVPGRVAEVVRVRSFLSAASQVPICSARLAGDGVLLGAGELALQPLLDHPRRWSPSEWSARSPR